MAIYEFVCEECGNTFNISGRYETIFYSDKNCPVCKSKKVKRKYGNISVIYKGKGFYNTDNKGK